jgi:radical SAM superfamily enzyme with C-terminal helix-hairpin-helix motif
MNPPPNFDLETGICYGYISSDSLDQEVVQELMYGPQAVSLSFKEAYAQREAEIQKDLEVLAEEQDEAIRVDWVEEELSKAMANEEIHVTDEEIVEGTYEGVHYISSWLGGALHFFITQSLYTSRRELCSMCVPGAGNLNSVESRHGHTTYDVPKDWRAEDPE